MTNGKRNTPRNWIATFPFNSLWSKHFIDADIRFTRQSVFRVAKGGTEVGRAITIARLFIFFSSPSGKIWAENWAKFPPAPNWTGSLSRIYTDEGTMYGKKEEIRKSMRGGHNRRKFRGVGLPFRNSIVEFNLKLGTAVRIPPQLISRSSHT